MISSPWMCSSRTQPGGGGRIGGGRVSIWRDGKLVSRTSYLLCSLSSGDSITIWESLAREVGRRKLTNKATAQPSLRDGTIVGIATQIQLLIQV